MLRYSIFTGGVVMANGSCRARFLREQSRCGADFCCSQQAEPSREKVNRKNPQIFPVYKR